jgi:ABC-type Fe3+ transport system substrate-binding protein
MMVLPETHIKQLLAEYPESMEFLWPFRRAIDPCCTVDALAKQYYLPVDTFITGLNGLVRRVAMNPCDYPAMKRRVMKKSTVNMAGFVTFTWQQQFEEELARFANQKRIKLNLNIFPKPEKGAFQNYLARCESPDHLPDILLGKGFSSLMTRQFVDQYLKTGIYRMAIDVPYHPAVAATSLYDPEHHFHTFGVNEFLMVYDKTKECPAGIPTSWSDLLLPDYKGMITQMGKNLCDHFGFVLLFYLYHIYGEDSIRNYVTNVRAKQHFAQMVKNMASGHPDASPINALHGFTTTFIRSDARPFVEVINPVDGNPVVSHFFLIKHDAPIEAIEMARHLYSPQIGQIIEKGGTIHVASTSNLAEGKRLKWIGWDAVRNAPLPYLKEYLGQVATQIYQEMEMNNR